MRFSIALILLFSTKAAWSQKPTALDSIAFEEAVKKIESEHQVKFAFDAALLARVRVAPPTAGASLAAQIQTIIDPLRFRYEINDRVVLIIPLTEKASRRSSFSGKVIDEQSGEPLPYAILTIPEVGIYTTTNQDGFFNFIDVPYDTSLIQVSYLGYAHKALRIKDFNPQVHTHAIKMSHADRELDEVTISNFAHKAFLTHATPSHLSINLNKFNSLANFGELNPFRAVQLFPGVSANNETASGLEIRGGDSGQNLVLFDGFTVYHLDHFYGIYSAFNADVIKDIQLYKSGYGASWGTRVSGVLDITSKLGNINKVAGKVGINLMSASATLEAPISTKTSLLLAGRRAYSDIIESDLYKKLFDYAAKNELQSTFTTQQRRKQSPIESSFYFYDINAKLTHRFDADNLLQISYYEGADHLKQRGEAGVSLAEDSIVNKRTTEFTQWGNQSGSVAYSRQWSAKLYTKVGIAGTRFFRNQNYQVDDIDPSKQALPGELHQADSRNQLEEYSLKLKGAYKFDDHHSIKAGLYSLFNRIGYRVINNHQPVVDKRIIPNASSAYLSGAFTSYLFSPNTKWNIEMGIRASVYSLSSSVYWEPRFSLSYKWFKLLTLKGAIGKYYQFISNIRNENASIRTINDGNFWYIGGTRRIPITDANHYVLGFTLHSPWFELDAEAFYKRIFGRNRYFLTYAEDDPSYLLPQLLIGDEKIQGIELLLKKQTKAYNGWLAYTLSSSQNRFEKLEQGNYFPSDADVRHEVKWVNLFHLKRWELSATWMYSSGRPYSVIAYDVVGDEGLTFDLSEDYRPNIKRLPDYHRLDIGASYAIPTSKDTTLKLGINILNVYHRKNVRSIIQYDYYKNGIELIASQQQKVDLLGLTPSCFVKFSF